MWCGSSAGGVARCGNSSNRIQRRRCALHWPKSCTLCLDRSGPVRWSKFLWWCKDRPHFLPISNAHNDFAPYPQTSQHTLTCPQDRYCTVSRHVNGRIWCRGSNGFLEVRCSRLACCSGPFTFYRGIWSFLRLSCSGSISCWLRRDTESFGHPGNRKRSGIDRF